jgi:hypothetical protein
MIRMLDAQAILGLYERAERENPVDRALSILAAFTSEERATLAALAVNQRDSLLLASRIAAFGAALDGVATCPACGCKSDASLSLPESPSVPTETEGVVQLGDRTASFRLPNSYDLADAARASDLASAERILLERCQLSGELEQPGWQAIDAEISRLCDSSTLELRITCTQCDTEFVTGIDVLRFFWDEFVSYADGLIEDVDALAARYGWAEADILAMTEWRRRRYLEQFR